MSNQERRLLLVVENCICIFKVRTNIMLQLHINKSKVCCNKMRMKVYILEERQENIHCDCLNCRFLLFFFKKILTFLCYFFMIEIDTN